MANGFREAGEFCWFNMLTPRPSEACVFFAGLLGWTYFEMPGVGHGVTLDGRKIGGLFDLEGPNTPPNTRAHIGVMVRVDSADATGERVRSLGGKARPAFDIGGQGRMAVCTDPLGAEFDIWEPNAHQGTDIDALRQGAPTWFEVSTPDTPHATEFYASLFGWTPRTSSPTYTTFSLRGTGVAGLMPTTPDPAGARPRWTTYFSVDDIEATMARAIRFGARLDGLARDVSGLGRSCGITSPQGVAFGVIDSGGGRDQA